MKVRWIQKDMCGKLFDSSRKEA